MGSRPTARRSITDLLGRGADTGEAQLDVRSGGYSDNRWQSPPIRKAMSFLMTKTKVR
jgi:hypothetical protein